MLYIHFMHTVAICSKCIIPNWYMRKLRYRPASCGLSPSSWPLYLSALHVSSGSRCEWRRHSVRGDRSREPAAGGGQGNWGWIGTCWIWVQIHCKNWIHLTGIYTFLVSSSVTKSFPLMLLSQRRFTLTTLFIILSCPVSYSMPPPPLILAFSP